MNGHVDPAATPAARQGRTLRAIAALVLVMGVWAALPVLLFFAFFGDHNPSRGPDPRDTILVVWLAVTSVVVLGALALSVGARRQHPVVFAFTLVLGSIWLLLSALGIVRAALL